MSQKFGLDWQEYENKRMQELMLVHSEMIKNQQKQGNKTTRKSQWQRPKS